jgi:hypothetical protein
MLEKRGLVIPYAELEHCILVPFTCDDCCSLLCIFVDVYVDLSPLCLKICCLPP